MIARAMLVTIVGLVLGACAPQLTFQNVCSPGPQGPPRLIPVNIIYTPDKIVDPGMKCARPGDVLWFRLNGKPDKDASVEGKTANDIWIQGSGKIFPRQREGWFFVPVPVDVIPDNVEEEDFGYTIRVDGSPDLDPEVRIRHNY